MTNLPPRLRRALEVAESVIAAAELATWFLEARAKVMADMPDNWVRDGIIEAMTAAYEMQIYNLTRPRYSFPGGDVRTIIRREDKP